MLGKENTIYQNISPEHAESTVLHFSVGHRRKTGGRMACYDFKQLVMSLNFLFQLQELWEDIYLDEALEKGVHDLVSRYSPISTKKNHNTFNEGKILKSKLLRH